jgi:MFS family permease
VRKNGCACDRLGARRALTAGLGLFMLASAGCGLAPSVSYLSTAHKWGICKLDALRSLFDGSPWLPPGLEPAG